MILNSALIREFISRETNMHVFCPHQNVCYDLVHRAAHLYEPTQMRKNPFNIVWAEEHHKKPFMLRFTTLDRNKMDSLRGFRGVIMLHPDVHYFDYAPGLWDELQHMIKHNNGRYAPWLV